jgi:hypothetical protein
MRRTALVLGLIAAAFLSAGTGTAHAQATRTWVSGVGDDANPCSRTAPCKTFAGAISKTAAGGEIDALDPGGFGALTITKSITIDGGGGQVASVLVAGTNGIVVAAGPTDIVIIRNIRMDGLLGNGSNSGNAGINGIRFLSGATLLIENCNIFGFNNDAIDIVPNQQSQVVITDTVVSNSPGGIQVRAGSASNVLVSLKGVLMDATTAFGLRADGRNASGQVNVDMVDSQVVNGGGDGVQTFSGPGAAVVIINRSQITNNSGNGLTSNQAAGSAARISVSESTISGNSTMASSFAGGTIISYQTNITEGNFVSNGTFTGTQTLK